MKKFLKIALPIAGLAAAAAAAAVYLVAPAQKNEAKRAAYEGRNFAHRGLHKLDKSVPENSIPAFEAAAEAGYGIELDVHITKDDELAVIHDDDLKRMCGTPERVEDLTMAELKEKKLCGTEETIPTLREALETIDSRTPVIVELKRGSRNEALCEGVLRELDGYYGHACIESFDPFIVGWFRKNAPDILRGQLSCSAAQLGGPNKLASFALSRLLLNFIGRPDFVAYGLGKKPWTVRLCEALGAMKVAWTSRDWAAEEDNDAVIFEFYRPRPQFK